MDSLNVKEETFKVQGLRFKRRKRVSGVFQGRWGVGKVELIPQFALSSISQAKLHTFNRMSNSAFNRLPRQKHLRKRFFFTEQLPVKGCFQAL